MNEPTTHTPDEALRAALVDWARTYGFGGRAFISGTYAEVADALLPVVRAPRDRLTAAVLELADELAKHTVEPETDADRGFIRGLDYAARQIRAVVTIATSEATTP